MYYCIIVSENIGDKTGVVMGFFEKLCVRSVGDHRKERLIMMRVQTKHTSRGMLITLGMVVCLFLTGCRDKRDKSVEHLNRGMAYMRIDQHDMAISEFTKAVEINPTYAIAYEKRGHVYCSKGDYERAISDYTTVIRINTKLIWINPKDAYSWRIRGDVFLHRGRAYYAQHEYDRAIFELGMAIEDYTKAIEINPKNDMSYIDRANAYYERSEAYERKGEHDEAKKDSDNFQEDREKAESLRR